LPNVIKIKNNGTAGVAPSSLVAGELALNRADGLLYYSNTSSTIAAIGDVVDGGVVSPANLLLLKFDGTTTDSSTYARTVTAVGNATTSTVEKKFGTHSAIFDGSGDRFDIPSSADFNLGGTDHTVDFWMWINSSTNGQNERLVVFEGTTQTRGLLISDTTKTAIGVNLFGSGWQILSSAGAISNQTWIHVALVRSGSTTTLYINGTSVGSTTAQCLPTTNSSVSIGGNTVRFASSNFNGYIDEVRISNTAVWTSNFTPPTSAYSQSSGSSARTQSIRVRGGTAATLASVNPTPAVREPVYETDTRLLKIGDGTTAYNSLGYVRPQVTATDRLLGRSSAGAGAAEEITCTSFARTLLDDTDAATARTTLGLVIGTNVQAQDAELSALAGLTSAADRVPYFTGSGTAALAILSADARTNLLSNSNVFAARAWANMASSNSNLTGTYSQSGTTVTVTATGHGLIAGQTIYSDITSGTGVDGQYTVASVTSANIFTYTAGTSLTTSGNITLVRNVVNASGNVSSVADLGPGLLGVSFSTAMQDANYAAVVSVNGDAAGGGMWLANVVTSSLATTGFQVVTRYSGSTASLPAPADFSSITVAVFR
jgi:hypothetical protein